MQLIDYPNLEEHRKIHKEIIQTMINLIKRYQIKPMILKKNFI